MFNKITIDLIIVIIIITSNLTSFPGPRSPIHQQYQYHQLDDNSLLTVQSSAVSQQQQSLVISAKPTSTPTTDSILSDSTGLNGNELFQCNVNVQAFQSSMASSRKQHTESSSSNRQTTHRTQTSYTAVKKYTSANVVTVSSTSMLFPNSVRCDFDNRSLFNGNRLAEDQPPEVPLREDEVDRIHQGSIEDLPPKLPLKTRKSSTRERHKSVYDNMPGGTLANRVPSSDHNSFEDLIDNDR